MVMNAPTHWPGRWIYPHQGPVRLHVQFPPGRPGEREPLVTLDERAERLDVAVQAALDE